MGSILVEKIALNVISMNKRTWFETRVDGMCASFNTENEARKDVENCRDGRPDNKFMSEENREYWKKAAEKMVVIKVTRIEEIL